MKITNKNLCTTMLALLLTLLCNQAITAEQDLSQVAHEEESSDMSQEGLRGVNPQLAQLLGRLSSITVNQIVGTNPNQSLSTLTTDVTNLGTSNDVSGLYQTLGNIQETLLLLAAGQGLVTSCALTTDNSSANLLKEQIGLVQLSSRQSALTSGITTSSSDHTIETDVATYNSSIAIALTSINTAITAVQTYISSSTQGHYNAALADINSALSEVNLAIYYFDVVVNDNAAIPTGPTLAQVNSALMPLIPQLNYLQSMLTYPLV